MTPMTTAMVREQIPLAYYGGLQVGDVPHKQSHPPEAHDSLHVCCMLPIPHQCMAGFHCGAQTANYGTADVGPVKDAGALEHAVCRGTSEDHEKHPDWQLQAQAEPDP